ncbi:MAG TPA: BamA/TamA family outer membrane protein [Steroidobacteraceae bacterium]|nr:BamA/TamA family outer membrane protein [Steroidobacteraceae bacterium]
MKDRAAECLRVLAFGALACMHVGAAFGALPSGLARWLDPATAPFIPVPEIDVDPNSGTTLGLIPTWLVTDDHAQIRKIIAPDVIRNPYFGWGARGRIFSYPSDNTQWSVVVGAKQRVESEFDYEYQAGRLRDSRWSFNSSVVYDRSGTPRFYGIGNNSPVIDETNYTLQQKYIETTLGLNLTHQWQIAYTLRVRAVAVQPGSLAAIASIQTRFAGLLGIGLNHEILNRIAIIYDTRNDPTVPTSGGAYAIFGGVAASRGFDNPSLYSVTGFDARQFWSFGSETTIAAHLALRYMPGATNVPFWSLSSIGGDRSVLGEAQPLRGFGAGRFYGRNSFSSSIEYRRRVLSLNAMATHIDIELTPFIDVGKVFAHSRSSPFSHLHHVVGLGFRGIARPFVVGYVDVGYGSEGAAVFTGINYPF